MRLPFPILINSHNTSWHLSPAAGDSTLKMCSGWVRIPQVLQLMKKKSKIRNGIAVAMNKSRKGGVMSNKKTKRKNGKNKQREYLNECD